MALNTNLVNEVCVEDARNCLAFDTSNISCHSSINLSKLSKREEAVIFFDWDDTLMASSAIAKMGLCPKYIHEKPDIPADVHIELRYLEQSVVQLLEKALEYGRVIIITAAESGWVELSASLFMPNVLPLLHTHIKVVSARSSYEYMYPDCPRRWKIEAFNQEIFPLRDFEEEWMFPKHIISLGDGPTEREALINLKMQAMDRCHGKSMKFITYPNISELRLEVELILANMEHLCTHDGDLDLQITWEMLNRGCE